MHSMTPIVFFTSSRTRVHRSVRNFDRKRGGSRLRLLCWNKRNPRNNIASSVPEEWDLGKNRQGIVLIMDDKDRPHGDTQK